MLSVRMSILGGLCPKSECFYKRTVDLLVLYREVSGKLLDGYVEALAKVLKNIKA